jgi:hypothetical protein
MKQHTVFKIFFERWSHFVIQAGLELAILLPQPSKFWDYKCTPQCLPSKRYYFIEWF